MLSTETDIRKIRHLSVQHGAICFFHMLTVTNKNKLLNITSLASKIIGISAPDLSDSVITFTLCEAHKILNDPDHPLYQYFIPLPSVRRYSLPCLERPVRTIHTLNT